MSLWTNPARFKVVVAGRRWGKTTWLREMLLKFSDTPNNTIIYVAPTRMQAKDILWNSLKSRLDNLGWFYDSNESELKITRANQSTIELKSAEKPGRIRGRGIGLIAFDEYAEYRSNEIWTQVARPALSDKLGRAIFTGTPKGFNHLYDLFNQAKTKQDWSAHSFKTIDSPFFQTEEGKQEIEDAKALLSERDFKQEYEASFENFAGRIYYAFDRNTCHAAYEFDQSLPIIVGMDFNKNPMTCTLHQRKAGVLYQFDEIYLPSSDTPEMCRVIKQRFPKSFVACRPDATGSRSYSVNKNLSDHAIIREFGFTIETGNVNPSRVDRWAAVNRAFEKGLSKVNVDKCPKTVKDLEVLCYKDGTCDVDLRDPMLGHISDAHGYVIYKEFPIMQKISVSRYA